MEYAVIIPIASVMECDVEGLATNITGCTVRGLTLAEECALEGNTTDETELALKRLMAVVTKCTVKGLVTNETERAVMAISAAVTQCGAIWNFL